MKLYGIFLLICTFTCTILCDLHIGGILYPRETETRQLKTLDGLWDFVVQNVSTPFEGFNQKWYKTSLKTVSPNKY